jgi:predicted nucleic acid-binding protein
MAGSPLFGPFWSACTRTVTDAGPLIALIDADEPDHERCRDALETIRLPLLTAWPAFTEAMYLLARAGGARSSKLKRRRR